MTTHRRALIPVLALSLLAACGERAWTERVVWSPDGAHAAIVARDGLYLSDADGTLSPLGVSDVYDAAWLGDSRLVLARRRTVSTLSELTDALGPAQAREFVVQAEAVWHVIQGASSPSDAEERLDAIAFESWPADENVLEAILMYLHDRHGDAIRELAGKWPDWFDPVEALKVNVTTLVVADLAEDRLEPGLTLYTGLSNVEAIDPAPGGLVVAFRTSGASSRPDYGSLLAVPIEGSATDVVVVDPAAGSFDWLTQGRSLVYMQTLSGGTSPGRLVEREVVSVSGRLEVGSETLLAELVPWGTVHCLPDGHVLFSAPALHLPTTEFYQRDQLFVLDRARVYAGRMPLTPLVSRPGLDSLPRWLSAYTVSPDGKQLLIASDRQVLLMTIANGSIERFEQGDTWFSSSKLPPPAWRSASEFTYVKNEAGRNELVLRRGKSEIVLSRSWPDRMLQRQRKAQ